MEPMYTALFTGQNQIFKLKIEVTIMAAFVSNLL
jgi:hypothetical protein